MPYHYSLSNIFCSGITVIAVSCLSSSAMARVFETVEVRGAEFIPAEDVQMTCGALPDVDYGNYDLLAIEECLYLTGAFENVSVFPENKTLVIEVLEIDTRPGRIEGAISYVSDDGFVGEFFLEQYNLFPGVYGSANLSFNSEIKSLEANLYRADAFGQEFDFGLEILGRETDFDDMSYSDQLVRVEPYVAWTPHDDIRMELGLGWRDYKLYDVDPSASPLLLKEETDSIANSYLRLSFAYSRNLKDIDGSDEISPRLGYGLRADQYVWNLGSDDVLSDTRLELNARFPLGADYQLISSLRTGFVTGLNGNDTRAIDRFFPGADGFRGFAPRGIGPRDGEDALGGNQYLIGSVEVQRDLGTVLSVPTRAGLFVDSGSSWGLDDTLSGRIDDGWHSRVSVGLSVTVEVAQTPVSIYFAQPLVKESGDEVQKFGLGFTARF